MASPEKLEVEIIVGLKSLVNGLKSASGHIRRWGSGVRKVIGGAISIFQGLIRTMTRVAIGMTALAAATTYALFRFGRLAAEAEDVDTKFAAVFKHLTKEGEAWAKKFAKQTGFATTSIKGWLATLQDTFVPLGFAREESAKMAERIVTLAADLASFNPSVQDTQEAIELLVSGLVGNHETLRRFGVIITETEMKQKALALGIIKAKEEMTSQQKVLVRLQMIMDGTSDAQGDLARTTTSWKNTMQRLSGQMREFGEGIGKRVLPHMKDMAGEVARWVRDAGPLLIAVFGRIFDTFAGRAKEVVDTLLPRLRAAAATMLAWLLTHADEIAGAVRDTAIKILEWVGTAVSTSIDLGKRLIAWWNVDGKQWMSDLLVDLKTVLSTLADIVAWAKIALEWLSKVGEPGGLGEKLRGYETVGGFQTQEQMSAYYRRLNEAYGVTVNVNAPFVDERSANQMAAELARQRAIGR